MPHILSSDQIADYHRDGFVIARGFFAADEIDLLRSAAKVDRALYEHSFGRADGRVVLFDCRCGTIPVTAFTECLPAVSGSYEARRNCLAVRSITTTRK